MRTSFWKRLQVHDAAKHTLQVTSQRGLQQMGKIFVSCQQHGPRISIRESLTAPMIWYASRP
jgi:hypothetical protein